MCKSNWFCATILQSVWIYFTYIVIVIAFQPPTCSGKRPKRQTNNDNKDEDGQPATIEVYSGLYVNENVDVSEGDDDTVLKERVNKY